MDMEKVCKNEGLSYSFFVAKASSIVRELGNEYQSIPYLKEKIRHVTELITMCEGENE